MSDKPRRSASVGRAATVDDLNAGWELADEIAHFGFLRDSPASLDQESTATYVQPIARAMSRNAFDDAGTLPQQRSNRRTARLRRAQRCYQAAALSGRRLQQRPASQLAVDGKRADLSRPVARPDLLQRTPDSFRQTSQMGTTVPQVQTGRQKVSFRPDYAALPKGHAALTVCGRTDGEGAHMRDWTSCLIAPIVEAVARAPSSMLIPFILSMVSTARRRSERGATRSSKGSRLETL
jgi:hypothetical protein